MWIYVPILSSHCVQESVPSISGLSWRFQLLEQFLTVKGKHIVAKSWLRTWQTKSWMKRLFGRILTHSTGNLFAEKWIASFPAIPVSPSPAPESVKEATIPGISGPTSGESWKKYVLPNVSLRTSQTTCISDFSLFVKIYKRWVIQSRRDSLARRKSGRRTKGNASLSWPTPGADGGCNARGSHARQTAIKNGTYITGRKNPLIGEWLMGIPPMWTAIGPLGIASFQSWRLTHTRLLAQLCANNG